jgi:hypothetical protein
MPSHYYDNPGFENVLNAVAGQNRRPGAPTRDIGQHANIMRQLARAGAPVFGDTLTSAGLQTAGFANEAVDALRGLLSRGNLSGFDQTDLVSNKVGIDQGLADARSAAQAAQEPAPEPEPEDPEDRYANLIRQKAAMDQLQAIQGMNPATGRRSILDLLNKKHEIEGSDGGLEGVLAAMGGQ